MKADRERWNRKYRSMEAREGVSAIVERFSGRAEAGRALDGEEKRFLEGVAGTMVVFRPKAMLLPDLGGTKSLSTAMPARRFQFTDAQLEVYGIYELQVLEGVLRKDDNIDKVQSIAAVADKIKTKIQWPRDDWYVDPEAFLREFYVALRARLEKKMLFGKRVTDKFSAQRKPE